MPTLTLRPNANGHAVSMNRSGCAYNYQCVDEEVSDGDTSYTYHSSFMGGSSGDYYALPNHTTEFGTILSVTTYDRARATSSGYCSVRVGCYTYNTAYYSSWFSLGTSYANYNKAMTLNPYTNQPWTWTEIDNLELYVSIYSSMNVVGRSTQAWVEVVYLSASTAGRRARFLRF